MEITGRGLGASFSGTSERSTPFCTTRLIRPSPRYGATRESSRLDTAISASTRRAVTTLSYHPYLAGMK